MGKLCGSLHTTNLAVASFGLSLRLARRDLLIIVTMASQETKPIKIDFFFDIMCPWAYQTSIWIREVRRTIDLDINWRFFSLEEINREEGKKHPWERELAYGWTPLRIAAWLRRKDMDLCDDWYLVAARALHENGLRPYEEATARELLESISAPSNTWDEAIADQTTHDDVRLDHQESVTKFAAFGVPLIVFENGRGVFGPVVVPPPFGDEALKLWSLMQAYSEIQGLYEIKTPKTQSDLENIANVFSPYLKAREWRTVQTPAP